ncbi:6,7-dimethyl-8-ribityllumazine synthase [Reyranella sp. CPCC 100927]|uniref:6,7-dimethyl-8-ribityllumazine synthase n=1 Tax=Reyranella sp. CPCC 100927 TaxID=2599616 RepID=UPI0011B527DF|nr:6,7-dimethyl-8-ribityllumazine synthase [Reyranella sp. CPCC 100927]TWT09691.1 6,7-dimethyl-8-ribityllumazine synthase [Reyranella sp. CPCC 100927]
MAEAQRGARPLVTPLPAGARVLIVEARFYEALADELATGALAELARHDVVGERLGVPGAFEIPGAIAMAADSGRYQGYIALGCVIRGETSHYDYVCGESARGLMDLTVRRRLAIGYGILTVENDAQAWARARRGEGDKGADAAYAALSMMALRQTYRVTS